MSSLVFNASRFGREGVAPPDFPRPGAPPDDDQDSPPWEIPDDDTGAEK